MAASATSQIVSSPSMTLDAAAYVVRYDFDA